MTLRQANYNSHSHPHFLAVGDRNTFVRIATLPIRHSDEIVLGVTNNPQVALGGSSS